MKKKFNSISKGALYPHEYGQFWDFCIFRTGPQVKLGPKNFWIFVLGVLRRMSFDIA